MAFIVPSHNLPTVGRFIYRYLVSIEGGSVERDELWAMMVPPGMQGPAGRTEAVDNPFAMHHTVRSLGLIGLLEEDGDCIALGGALTDEERDPQDPDAAFPVLVRRLLMLDEVDPWRHEDGTWTTEGASDLIRAVTWLLAQDALGAPLDFDRAEVRQAEQLTDAQLNRFVTDRTPWGNLERWGPYLGLVGRLRLDSSTTYLTPDPTVAVRHLLANELSETLREPSPLPPVLDQISEFLPVLGGGRHQEQLARLTGRDVDQSGTVPSALSQALLTLRDEGVIELTSRSDAKGISVLQDGPSQQRFTHIRLT